MTMTSIRTYADADAACVQRGKPSQTRKLANNTYLNRRGADIAVTLHSTDVVTYHPDNTVTLATGGWQTVTTKDRINAYAPFRVWSERGRWMVCARPMFGESSRTAPFLDGGRVTMAGVPADDATRAMVAAEEQAQRDKATWQRRVTKYVNGFRFPFSGGDSEETIRQAIGGDCLICRPGWPAGSDHIVSHLAENYHVTSLVATAMRHAGYRPDMFLLLAVGRGSNRPSALARRVLRKYLNKQLAGVPAAAFDAAVSA